jgi:hypothetical protein
VPAVGVHGVRRAWGSVSVLFDAGVWPSLVTAAARTRMPTRRRRAASLR